MPKLDLQADNRLLFEETGDAIYVWQAIKEFGPPYEPWVVGYLTETADQLLSIHREGKYFPQTVVDKLRIKRKSLNEAQKSKRDLEICVRISGEFTDKPFEGTRDEQYSQAAEEYGLKKETIEKMFKKYRSQENKYDKEMREKYSDDF